MKITITVSESSKLSDKLFRREIEDRFQEFFSRVIVDITNNLNNESTYLCGRYELETAKFLKNVFDRGQYERKE